MGLRQLWARLKFLLVVTSGITIGSHPLTFTADTATIRDEETGLPFIPAASIKGVWRTASCYAATELELTCCKAKKPEEIEEAHRAMGEPCHVCLVYGFPGSTGIVEFSDAKPEIGAVVTNTRPGIEIDDYTGTVAEGKLFYREVIAPGSIFKLDIEIFDDPTSPGNKLDKCLVLKLLLRAASYVEAVGLGRGSARPWLYMVEKRDGKESSKALTASEATTLTSCSGLEEDFSRIWLPKKSITFRP